MRCPNCKDELTYRYDLCLKCGKQIWKSPVSSEEIKRKRSRLVVVLTLVLIGGAFMMTSFVGGPSGSGTAPYIDFRNYPIVTYNNIVTGECPASCDDSNACTNDFCDAATNYKCSHHPITPCCGNGICDSDETSRSCANDCTAADACGNGICDSSETCSSCEADCGCGNGVACVNDKCEKLACAFSTDCNDGDSCTKDVCNNAGSVNAVCAHEAINTCNKDTKDDCCPPICDKSTDADCEYYCDEEGNCSTYPLTPKT